MSTFFSDLKSKHFNTEVDSSQAKISHKSEIDSEFQKLIYSKFQN